MMALTACRSNEVRGMHWSEIDFDAAVWTIPGPRMKARRPHRVPLAAPALAILERLHQHRVTFWDWLDHWQTLIAGGFALLAGIATVVATMIIANRQITAARKQGDRVIAATRAQTEATFKQTAATVRLEEQRNLRETLAFQAMLEAAMRGVLAEAAWARMTYPSILTQKAGSSVDAHVVRTCITKGAFAELRGACVRQGSPLTGQFLDLECEIDNFALQWVDTLSPTLGAYGVMIREGKHAGLGEKLALIETNAKALRAKAVQDPWGLTLPGRAGASG